MNLDFSIIPKYTGYLLTATGVTIKVTLLALVFGFLLAVPLAFMKISHACRCWYRSCSYTSACRSCCCTI